ncbi:MAG: hypothetical protein JWL70_3007, partial [Acidimicrobiia bacterium]|nr:hypothetical protein [Acidimicrobiia bacterium]
MADGVEAVRALAEPALRPTARTVQLIARLTNETRRGNGSPSPARREPTRYGIITQSDSAAW